MNRLLLRTPAATRGEKAVATTAFSPRVGADLVPVGIAAGVGGLLAAIELGTRSLWLDEASSFAIASQHGAALWHAIAHDGGNMLGYYLLLHVVIAWFGDASWLLRLPSVIANAATGALVAAVALRLFPGNRRLATGAGLLAVVSLPLVFWAQNARGYAWLVTFSVGSFLALLALLQTPSGQRPSRAATLAYVLTTLAALYVGYDIALLIPAQLALLILFRERARLVVGCLALTLLLSVPLLVLAAERGSGQLFWVQKLTAGIAGQAAVTLLSAALPPNFHRTTTTVATVIVMALATIVALAIAIRAALRARSGAAPVAPLLFVLSWLLVPTVLTLLAYAAGEPIELARVTILVMPALALLLAWMLLRPATRPLLGLAGIAVLLALRLLQVIPSYGVSPEPWNSATAYVVRATPAGQRSCIAFYAQDGREAFDYYIRADGLTGQGAMARLQPVLPTLSWGRVRPYVEAYAGLDPGQRARIAGQCPRLWLVESHEGQAQGTARSRLHVRRFQRLEQELGRLYPHTSLRSFGWASKINVRLLYR